MRRRSVGGQRRRKYICNYNEQERHAVENPYWASAFLFQIFGRAPYLCGREFFIIILFSRLSKITYLWNIKVLPMDSIGKELISLCKAHRNFLAAKLAQVDLFPGQDGLLYHLSINDGQTMSELVEKMGIQHATLFNMIERMAKNDLVRKDKDDTDGRTSRIYLTRKGMKLLEQLSQVWKEIEMQLRQNLSAMEANTFILIARKISDNLSRN